MRTPIQSISDETLALAKQAFNRGGLEKAITVAGQNLVGYNLEAPSKKLYPVLSPLRNRIPRTTAPVGSVAANWRAITGINTANVKAAVAFGTRNATTISYSAKDLSATYKTFGLDDSVEFEAVWLSRGFEDVRALSALSTLQATMIEEEKLILGGNVTALGTPTTPTLTTTAADGGSWGGVVTVYVKVMALPLYGWLNSTRTDLSVALADHSVPSGEASVASVAADGSVTATAGYMPGAFAYAWFVGTASGNGNLRLASITTAPTAKFTSVNASGITATANGVTDTAADTNAFDGLYPQTLPVGCTLTTLENFASGTLKKVTAGASTIVTGALAYDMNLASGTGTALTADNAGGVVEIDAVLKALWDEARIGPTVMLMNSQEALNITKKIGGSSNLSYRVMLEDGDKTVTGGIFVSSYLNKFSSSLTPGSPDAVPLMIHPFLPPGTIIILSERLPYPNNQVPNVFEMELQQEYADFEWALTQRRYEHGVYANGVLKGYFPAGCAVIRGINNG